MSVTVMALNRVNGDHAWGRMYDVEAGFRQAAGITRALASAARPGTLLLSGRSPA